MRNLHAYTIYSVLYSIHHCRPSAWATLMLGVVTPATKKIWHPMWGLWLVDRNAAARHPQEHVSQPMADTKVVWKQSSFGEKNTINIQHYSSSQQANFSSACYHHTAHPVTHSEDHVPEGSTQITSGDTRLGMETRPSSYRCGTSELTSLSEKGQSEFLPRESGHLKWGVNQLCWPQEKEKTAQWMVYGARSTWLYGAWSTKHCGSAKCTELFL